MTTYTYDANGNQTSIEEPNFDLTTNTWDYENRMTVVEQPDNSLTTFTYNQDRPGPFRIGKEDDDGYVGYVWDKHNIIAETDEFDVAEVEYDLVPAQHGKLLARREDSESSFYHFDATGSTRQLTDSSEVISDSYSYTAFGKPHETTGTTPNNFTYKGEQGYLYNRGLSNSDSLYTLRRRQLSANTGRFTSEDPIRDDEQNLYRYVNNDPVNQTDPSGLSSDNLWAHDKWERLGNYSVKIKQEKYGFWSSYKDTTYRKYTEYLEHMHHTVNNLDDYTASYIFNRKDIVSTSQKQSCGRYTWQKNNTIYNRDLRPGVEITYPLAKKLEKKPWVTSSVKGIVMIKLSGGGEQPVLLPHSDYKSGIRSGKWIRTAADKGKNVDLKANPYFERPHVFNSVNYWLAEAAGIPKSKVNQISPASPSRKPQSFGELLLQEILMKSCSMVDLVFEQKKPCSSLISLLGMGKQEVLAVKQIIESLFLGGTKVFNNVGEGVLKAFKSLTGKPPGVFNILAEAFMELIGLNTNSVSQFTSLLSAVWNAATTGTTKAWKGAISAGKDFFGLSTENLINWALEVIPASFRSAAKFVVSGFEALISGDFGSWLSGSVAKGIDQIKTTFESLLDSIPDKIKGFLFDAIIDKLPKLIGEYVVKLVGGPAGWIVGLADMLMGAINFIVGFIKKGVFQKIAAMIKRVQGGAGVGFVMQEILAMLPMLASIALRFLARITGADDVISAIASVFGNISSALHDLFVAAIRTIWNLIKKLFGAIRTWLFKKQGTKLYVKVENGQVVVGWNPNSPWRQFLDTIKDRNCKERARVIFQRDIDIQAIKASAQRFSQGTQTPADERNRTKFENRAQIVLDILEEDGCFEQQSGCNPQPETDSSSTTLGTNLEKTGYHYDGPRLSISDNPEAHHIVEGTRADAEASRQILFSSPVCISINDAVNGVFLPSTSGVTVPASTNPQGRVFHNKTQTRRYSEYVEKKLQLSNKTKAGVKATLTSLRSELEGGQINW